MHTQRYSEAKKVTIIGAIMNAFLGIIKLAGGFVFSSHALLADGMHSFSDLVTDVMVLFASKFGSQLADDTHPYGHKRIETAATLLLALLLVLAGAGIAWDAADELIHHITDKPKGFALVIAIFSILVNEALFHYTRFIGKKIQSSLIMANAWHHRSDAAASLIVTLGIIGSLAGWSYFDGIAAIIVGGLIIKMGLNYGWDSVKELVDTAVDPKTFAKIETIIQQVDGVERIHQLRSRFMGGDILIDVHILVAPKISVSEGHFIAQHVHKALIEQFERVNDVIVHVDPEDDENCCPSIHLPNRKTLEQQFLLPWQEKFPSLHNWTIHYLDGIIYVDLFYTLPLDLQQLAQTINASLSNQNLKINFSFFMSNLDSTPRNLTS